MISVSSTSRRVDCTGASGSPVTSLVPSCPGRAISWYGPSPLSETVAGAPEVRSASRAVRSAWVSWQSLPVTVGLWNMLPPIEALNVCGPCSWPHICAPPGTLSLS